MPPKLDIPTKILLVGVSGRLGHHLQETLKQHHYHVRALTRDVHVLAAKGALVDEAVSADITIPDTLHGACKDIDIVFSSAGASLDVRALRDRQSYMAVDYQGNLNLLKEAKRAGIKKFVYVSVFNGQRQRQLEYSDAHERFCEALAKSGMDFTVIRPTGFFGIFDEMMGMAESGRGVVIGDGSARTNPIHEADLAEVCMQALDSNELEIEAGGPEILTRRRTVELAFEVLGKKPKIHSIPPALFKTAAAGIKPFNPRIHALLSFGSDVSLTDTIAPQRGSRRLEDYYRELAAKRGLKTAATA